MTYITATAIFSVSVKRNDDFVQKTSSTILCALQMLNLNFRFISYGKLIALGFFILKKPSCLLKLAFKVSFNEYSVPLLLELSRTWMKRKTRTLQCHLLLLLHMHTSIVSRCHIFLLVVNKHIFF